MAESIEDVNSHLTVRVVTAVLREVGLDPEVEARALGVELATVGAIPRHVYHALWERASARGGAELGLEFAERLPRGSLGVLEWAAMSAPTLGEGLDTLATYGALLHTGGHYELDLRRDSARFVYLMTDGAVPPRPVIDWSLGYLLRCIRQSAPEGVTVNEIHVQYGRPKATSALEDVYRAPLVFDAPRNEIVFPLEAMRASLLAADPEVHASLRAVAISRADELRRESQVVSRVRALLTERIAAGDEPTLSSIAAGLGISERTLQRRLGDEGESFRALVGDARLVLAGRWLKDPSRTISEIAYSAGYKDPSAFTRAFRRKYGQTPAQFRSEPDE